MTLEQQTAVLDELKRRVQDDPLMSAYNGLTAAQKAFVAAGNREKVAEGGNQSGKSWSCCIDFLLEALGGHPAKRGQGSGVRGQWTWKGWYCTTTYERFAEQAWKHFKALLLYPGEQCHDLPTRNILAIGWDKKAPERPQYVRLRRVDGGEAEIWVKSYDQGAGEYQAAEVDKIALDEECTNEIYQECQPRVVFRKGQITVAATPVKGARWLANLRSDAENGAADVFHTRFDMRDNPKVDPGEIDKILKRFRNQPEMINLRLAGLPVALEGVVYNDLIFTPLHVCEPFSIPAEWTRFEVIDHGYRNCACLWFAVSPGEEQIVCYREYLGQERTIADNAGAIVAHRGGERIAQSWIDPATLGRDATSGERLIDLWQRSLSHSQGSGVRGQGSVALQPAPDNAVIAGIESVWELLQARREKPGATGPGAIDTRFKVFRSCMEFLRERRDYRWADARERGDEGPDKPIKRDDHLMDCWRYFVAAGARHRKLPEPIPAPGTVGRAFWEQRHPRSKERL